MILQRILILFLILLFYSQGFSGIRTPLELSGFKKLTAYEAMMAYLRDLSSGSKQISLKIIGRSVQGRDIPAFFISENRKFGSQRGKKPVVMIFCQQHGDEPSGKEAALIAARDLVKKRRDLLKKLDLILIPQVNPDGGEAQKRRNANGMDLNRNHVILSEPETLALHRVFNEWMPEVTLDVHEYNTIGKRWIEHGFTRDADEMLGGATNLNIEPELISFSREIFIPEIGKMIKEKGFTFHRYIVGSPFPGSRIRCSTTNINDGRQSFGIYNVLSFIFEGKRYKDPEANLSQRTKGQLAALLAFLETTAKYRERILNLVAEAQRQLLTDGENNGFSFIRMDYFPDPLYKTLNFPVFDLYNWKRVEKELENYEPLVKIKKSVKKPAAYIIPAAEKKLIELLTRHQIRMFRLKSNTTLEVEVYRVLHVTECTEEDKPADNVDIYSWTEKREIIEGSVLVFLNQGAANLIPLLLEPQSSWGIVTRRSGRRYRFSEYLQEGKEYPILRLMKPVPLKNLDHFSNKE